MKRPNLSVTLVVISLAITLPYLFAALMAGPEHVFTGLLLNPQDGASYLAKMYEGWRGDWRFTLPYTAEPGSGAYIYLYYLFLGHLARLSGLPLVIMYHLARLAGAGLLLWALVGLYDRLFRDRPDLYRLAFWLTLIGSGMGWLVVFLGQTPSDFWVAEAYPFLAMFTNPHFPTGLALLIWSFSLLIDPAVRLRNLKLLLAGLLISLIMQFGLVVALLIAAAWVAWTWIETRCLEWQPLVCLGLLGGPYLLYQYWAVTQDPVLAGWTAQNQAPSPAIWDFLLSFSPALILALVGAAALFRQKEHPARRLLIAWFALGLLLIYFPFALQRRFMLGFYIPTAALAIFGLDDLRRRFAGRTRRWLAPALFGLALPTNVLLILITVFGTLSHASELFLTRDEAAALNWINQQTPAHALVLASPEMGSWIPVVTGRRVIYGHPFETLNAKQEKQRVEDFFSGQAQAVPGSGLLAEDGVDYLLVGPREQELGSGRNYPALKSVFNSDSVTVYQVGAQP